MTFYIKAPQKTATSHQEITSELDNQSATSNSHTREWLALAQYSHSVAFANVKPAVSESLVFSLILVAFFSFLWLKYIVVPIRSCHNSK